MAKTLLNRLWEFSHCAAVAPLRQINTFSVPNVKHVPIIVEPLLDMVLKSNCFRLILEFKINPLRYNGAIASPA